MEKEENKSETRRMKSEQKSRDIVMKSEKRKKQKPYR